MKLVKCNKCKWVHFEMEPVPGTEVPKACFRCGNSYKDFVQTDDIDVPRGSTLQPILNRDE